MEIIGTVASFIVLLSFMVEGENKIRIVNVFGAVLFIIYGVAIKSFSVCFLNSALIAVHLYKLFKNKVR